MRGRSRSPFLTLLLSVVLTGSLAACQRRSAATGNKTVGAEIQRSAESARKSLDELNAPLAELKGKYAALHQEFEKLPADLPEFGDTRAKFYSAYISQGTMGAKVPWLASRIDAAVKSGDSAELQAISSDIANTHKEIVAAETIALEMLHSVVRIKPLVAEFEATRGKTSCENPNAAPPKKLSVAK